MQTKICTTCKKEKSIIEFRKTTAGKYGVDSKCKLCCAEYARAYYAKNRVMLAEKCKAYQKKNVVALAEYRNKNYLKNMDVLKARQKKYRDKNSKKLASIHSDYYYCNREKINERKKIYNEKNKEKIAADKHVYYLKNKSKARELSVKYRAQKLNATPKWYDCHKVAAVYLEAEKMHENGINVHVDHYYPLQGDSVSGLHVHENLVIIPAKENLRKQNFHPDEFYG